MPHSLLASNHFSTLPREVALYDFTEQVEKPAEAVKNADIIIDAVYGIGFKGIFKTILTAQNATNWYDGCKIQQSHSMRGV